jgi:hypothetical protein
MNPNRYGFRRYWSSQQPLDNGRSPIPGIDVYVTITKELTLEEFLTEWKNAYEDIRARVLKEVEGRDAQPAHHG